MGEDKQALRRRIWAALEAEGAARFPGAQGRIPNFRGAEAAAERLVATEPWQRARRLKCNPDAPQRPVRHAALKAGKTVFMAVPKLASDRPFIALEPAALDEALLWKASSIKGATRFGRPVRLEEVPPIDLIVTGCVAVGGEGARLGKGGGYSDLEYAVLRETGRVGARTPIVTTVHPVQVVDAGAIPVREHDITLDAAATPEQVIHFERRPERPSGVLWELLPERTISSIPVLQRRRPS